MERELKSHIWGLGIDLVDLPRFQRIFRSHRERFIEMVFSGDSEPTHTASEPLHYACVFAIKEAVFKAFGTGWGGGTTWSQVHVQFRKSGAAVRLTGELGRRARKARIRMNVSVTRAKNYALAVVIATHPPSDTILAGNAKDGRPKF
jgi:holo-[acyl-carrier protein] synthase